MGNPGSVLRGGAHFRWTRWKVVDPVDPVQNSGSLAFEQHYSDVGTSPRKMMLHFLWEPRNAPSEPWGEICIKNMSFQPPNFEVLTLFCHKTDLFNKTPLLKKQGRKKKSPERNPLELLICRHHLFRKIGSGIR